MTAHTRRHVRPTVVAVLVAVATSGMPLDAAYADLTGADAQLTRAPYLSDLTTSSVQVSWGTTTQSRGVVRYGPLDNCAANSVSSVPLGSPITVNGVVEYQNSVAVTGLSAGTSYCYRVYTGGAAPADLLGSAPTPRFTTLEAPGSSTPFTFDVFGDWGDTTNSGVNDGSINANQAALDAQLAASGARFAISTGDVGYQGGTQTNYGDLNQTGTDVSAVFGPSYWAVPGQSLPLHGVSGNHGQNAAYLTVWPQNASSAASGGTYTMVSYPSIDGSRPGSYPTSYYAFSTGNVRFYVLDAAWGNSNVGDATGGACGSHCAIYQVDHDAHWTATSAQYQWLAQDLAAHPGGLKIAAFHFPLRSDDATEPDDAYLKNTPGSTGTLEQLLHDNGVQLVFNGHAHDYQRNVSPPGGVISYTTGGGGGRTSSIGGNGCASTDAYAVGWSYSKSRGNACGAATAPTSDAQVYHFLKVSVDGATVTVAPTDSRGNTFDVKTYDFGPDTTAPSAPAGLTATQPSPTKTALTWGAATDNIALSAYDIYRNGGYLATTTPAASSYTDATALAGTAYTYQVVARDLAGNMRAATVGINGGGTADTTPPSAPGSLSATSASPVSTSLSWTAATDNIGVTTYTILRGGTAVATVAGNLTSYTDTGLIPGTAYTYRIVANDAAGNASPPSNQATISTQADTQPPSAPGTPTAASVTATQVRLAWAASTDNVGVLRYDVLRNGTLLAAASGTSFTDTTSAPGTTYTYAVVAYDAAGNHNTSGTLTITTPLAGSLFYDGFESGGLGQWTTVNGLTTDGSIRHTGDFAARESSTGTTTYAYENLPGSYSELWAQAWVYVVSRNTSATLIGFRTVGGGSIVNAYLDTNGRVSLRNSAAGVTTYGGTTIAAGTWHRVVLYARVDGASGSLDVWVDGVAVPGLSLTGQNLGTTPIGRLQLGETTTGRTYDIALDDVVVAPSAL